MAYLRGSAQNAPAGQSIEGVLVYPVGEQCIDLGYVIDGYPVRIYTLNLGQPTHAIEADLLSLLTVNANDLAA
jgi:hypothetical protein